MKVRRKEFDGVVKAYGYDIGQALEFEVPDEIAHFFKDLGYELVIEQKTEEQGEQVKGKKK